MDKVLRVLDDIENAGVIEKYAIGGAFAAILHNEPISTINLDIFFLTKGKKRKSDSEFERDLQLRRKTRLFV